MTEVEVGAVTAHPVVFAYKMVVSVFKTWAYARRNGFDSNRWYGVYEKGTETVMAQVGCLPGAKQRAQLIANAMNRR